MVPNQKIPNIPYNNICIYCHYNTSNKKDYQKHILTRKHLKREKLNQIEPFQNQKIPKIPKFNCENCCKDFFSKSGLWYHKKKCYNINKEKTQDSLNVVDNEVISYNNTNENIDKNSIIIELLKQNNELQNIIIKQSQTFLEQGKMYQNTITEIIPKLGNNNTINTINQKLNINIFLNEECKDAISMDEFINQMNISLPNLFYTRDKGIAEGVSNILIENLNKLPLNQRPIHCTDAKRETIYIKNEKWEKDENKKQTKEVIKRVSNLQIKNINKFKQTYPKLMENQKEKDDYMEIIKATTDDVTEKEDKIIKNVCKKVYINNNLLE